MFVRDNKTTRAYNSRYRNKYEKTNLDNEYTVHPGSQYYFLPPPPQHTHTNARTQPWSCIVMSFIVTHSQVVIKIFYQNFIFSWFEMLKK